MQAGRERGNGWNIGRAIVNLLACTLPATVPSHCLSLSNMCRHILNLSHSNNNNTNNIDSSRKQARAGQQLRNSMKL